MAALLRLPLQSPLFYALNFHNKFTNHHHRSKISASFFSSPSPIPPLSLADNFLIKARSFSNLIVHFSRTTQTPVAELKPDGETLEVEEFSKTRLIAQNVPWTYTQEDIRSLFEKHGSVLDIELSKYNKTKNRGLAFVEMGSPEEAAEALSKLDLLELEGRVVKINYAKSKKMKLTTPSKKRPELAFNLFVANISFEARAKQLREFFISEGANVISSEIIFRDNPRKSSGYGFVSFETKKEAEAALSAFQGKEFMGRPIRVAPGRQFLKLLELEGGSNSDDKPVELNSFNE